MTPSASSYCAAMSFSVESLRSEETKPTAGGVNPQQTLPCSLARPSHGFGDEGVVFHWCLRDGVPVVRALQRLAGTEPQVKRKKWVVKRTVSAGPSYHWFNQFLRPGVVPDYARNDTCFVQAWAAFLLDRERTRDVPGLPIFQRLITFLEPYRDRKTRHFEARQIAELLKHVPDDIPRPTVVEWHPVLEEGDDENPEGISYQPLYLTPLPKDGMEMFVHILPYDDTGDFSNMHAVAGVLSGKRFRNHLDRNQAAIASLKEAAATGILLAEAAKRKDVQDASAPPSRPKRQKQDKPVRAVHTAASSTTAWKAVPVRTGPLPLPPAPVPAPAPVPRRENIWEHLWQERGTQYVEVSDTACGPDPIEADDFGWPSAVEEYQREALRRRRRVGDKLRAKQRLRLINTMTMRQLDRELANYGLRVVRGALVPIRPEEEAVELRPRVRRDLQNLLNARQHIANAYINPVERYHIRLHRRIARERANLERRWLFEYPVFYMPDQLPFPGCDYDFEAPRVQVPSEPESSPPGNPYCPGVPYAQPATPPYCPFSRGYGEGTDHYPVSDIRRGKEGTETGFSYFREMWSSAGLEAIPLVEYSPQVILDDRESLFYQEGDGSRKLLYSILRSEPDLTKDSLCLDGTPDFRRVKSLVRSGTKYTFLNFVYRMGECLDLVVHSVLTVESTSKLDHVVECLGFDTPDHFEFHPIVETPLNLLAEQAACEAELMVRKSIAPTLVTPALSAISRFQRDNAKEVGLDQALSAPQVEAIARRATRRGTNNRRIVAGLSGEPIGLKQCQCCGRMQPQGKWRWKHRRCDVCSASLNQRGSVTFAGAAIQQRYQVGDCYPGVVRLQGVCKPPKASKWARADLSRGSLTWIDLNGVKQQITEPTFRYFPDAKYEPRWETELVGIGIDGCYPMVSARCATNQYKALVGRMYCAPMFSPNPDVYAALERLDLMPDLSCEEWTHAEWWRSLPPNKRREMARWIQRYVEDQGVRKKYAQFSSFVKDEHLCGFAQDSYPFWKEVDQFVDRLINAPYPATHVVAGPRIKPRLKRLKEHWGPESTPYYGGNTPEQDYRFLQRLSACRSWFWTDFSSYDNSFTDLVWDYLESAMYSDITDRDFWKVMKIWRQPCGTIGPFIFKGPTMNASGRDDTALANAAINGVMQQVCIAAAYNHVHPSKVTAVMIDQMRHDFVVGVCGDDMVAGAMVELDAGFGQRLCAAYAQFGFEAKYQESAIFEHAVFLGNRPVKTSSGWYWGRTIGRAAYKLGWQKLPCGDTCAVNHGTHDQLLRTFPHVPILADMAKKVCELQKGKKISEPRLESFAPWKNQLTPGWYDEEALKSTCRAYSDRFGMDELLSCIRKIEGVTSLPAIISHPVLDVMMAVDDM